MEDEITVANQPCDTGWGANWRAAICNWLFGELPELDVPIPIAEAAGEYYDEPYRTPQPIARIVASASLYNKSTISTMRPVAESVCPSTIVARCRASDRSTPSPTSVDAHPLQNRHRASPKEEADTEQTTTLPLVTLALSFMYHEMVALGHWNADFFRGRRPPKPTPEASPRGPQLWKRARGEPAHTGQYRTLATTHLSQPCSDGWNVIVGALELAREWGMCGGPEPCGDTACGEYELPPWMRKRLACCLIFAWKFNRSNYSCYPRRFYGDEGPSLMEPHTEELAHVAYAFLTLNEQAEFGEWGEANTEAIRKLYKEMLLLEVDLLTKVSTFPLLAENVQTHAEERLELLFHRGVRSAQQVMVLRSLLPFFLDATIGRLYERLDAAPKDIAGGALVCAAFIAVSTPESGFPLFVHSPRACKVLFNQLELIWALRILNAAACPERIVAQLMALGAFGDPTWKPQKYIVRHVLDAAAGAVTKLID